MTRIVALAVLSALFVASGCNQVAKYEGDGQLKDNGLSAATSRYVLDLGPADLTQAQSKSYRLRALPAEKFVVGLEVHPTHVKTAQQNFADVTISMRLSAGDRTIFSRSAPLKEWTWSIVGESEGAFVYGRESPSTFFEAEPDAAYTLMFEVTQPASEAKGNIFSIVAKSGGWK